MQPEWHSRCTTHGACYFDDVFCLSVVLINVTRQQLSSKNSFVIHIKLHFESIYLHSSTPSGVGSTPLGRFRCYDDSHDTAICSDVCDCASSRLVCPPVLLMSLPEMLALRHLISKRFH